MVESGGGFLWVRSLQVGGDRKIPLGMVKKFRGIQACIGFGDFWTWCWVKLLWLEGGSGFLWIPCLVMFWFIPCNPKFRLGIWHKGDWARINNCLNPNLWSVVRGSP